MCRKTYAIPLCAIGEWRGNVTKICAMAKMNGERMFVVKSGASAEDADYRYTLHGHRTHCYGDDTTLGRRINMLRPYLVIRSSLRHTASRATTMVVTSLPRYGQEEYGHYRLSASSLVAIVG